MPDDVRSRVLSGLEEATPEEAAWLKENKWKAPAKPGQPWTQPPREKDVERAAAKAAGGGA